MHGYLYLVSRRAKAPELRTALGSDGASEQNDLDVSIKAHKKDGFTIAWITVMHGADGERGGEEVLRR